MDYTPAPLDTSHIELDSEMVELLEKLAHNTHDVWANQRILDGWRYGPARNDALKEHPCLVLYEDLSEIEKEYDRVVVQQVIKAILAMGYRIDKSEAETNSPDCPSSAMNDSPTKTSR